MSKSIKQLIQIYENELSSLLRRSVPSIELSKISAPENGQKVKLANKDFTIVAVKKYIRISDTKKIDEFLNDEDKKIINEVENEIKNPLDNNKDKNYFDDDPYPDFHDDPENNWIIDEEDNIILDDEEAGLLDDDEDSTWNDVEDTRETTIAYYRPFHSSGSAFGIYYMRDGLRLKTRVIYDFCQNLGYSLDVTQVYVIVKTMTQFHEIYHHKIEAFSSRIEVVTRKPIYSNGFSAWYNRTRNNANCYEETFANCYCYYKTKNELKRYLNESVLHNIMVYWFRRQPIPYRNALRLINQNEELYRSKESLFFEIILKKLNPRNSNYGNNNSNVWSLFSHGTQPYINVDSNVYYIV